MKRRLTITIDGSVYEKLPRRNKSNHVNSILKQHYQKEGIDSLYEEIKKRILADKEIGEWIQYEGGTRR